MALVLAFLSLAGGTLSCQPASRPEGQPVEGQKASQQEEAGATSEPDADFAARCHAPGVIRCFGFDDPVITDEHVFPPWGETVKRGEVDTKIKASGAGSLRFTVPSMAGADTSGSFWLDFSDDYSAQFGPGQEFYIQWRQRFSPEFLKTNYQGSDGWKQIIVGEGDRPGHTAWSCTPMELVVLNGYLRGFPGMYHSCGKKDGQYEGLEIHRGSDILLQNAVGCRYGQISFPPCVGYKANQWMTFQMHVKVGTWYRNDHVYHHDTTVQLWVAQEGKPSVLVIDFRPELGTGYDLVNTDPRAKYGKLWLLPYNTNRNPFQVTPTAYVWYEELIISRSRIPDPK